nr:acetylserotonin O-methyltransferase [Streptomyces chartreusis]
MESNPSTPPTAAPLMALVAGVWAAQTLATAHELDLFSDLSGTDGTTFEEFAASHGFELRPAELLLSACAGLGLLERREERFVNTPLSEEYLVRGKPLYFGGMVEMAAKREYPAWLRLREGLETNRPLTWNPDKQESLFDGEDPVLVEIFWDAMYSLSISSSQVLAEHVDFSAVRNLLDVGGGGGAYDITLCKKYPELSAAVFDLPFVCELTQEKIDAADLGERIALEPGDMFAKEPFPDGYDAILLSAILHDWSESDDQLILAKCFEALPSGGMIVITELLVDDTKDGPASATLMSLNMLVETWGRNYTAAEYTAWLLAAGFTDVEVVRFEASATNGAVIARKP